MAPPDAVIAIRRRRPFLVDDDRISGFAEIARVLDRIRDGRQMNFRLALADQINGWRDVIDLLAGISPHQEHTHLNAVTLGRFGGPNHLIHRDAALHRVEDALAAAFRTDPD